MKSVKIAMLILCMAFLAVTADAASAQHADVPELQPAYSLRSEDVSKDSEIDKVLGVFEKKIGDQRVLSRLRLKLDAVDDGRLHMIASLSDKIDREVGIGDTIAFFLLTAMVIFS